ncbi:dual 3 5-cyclic-AMP and -GMP phosphodiesterase 11 [Biomphalaria pfeifferi]|uniref:Dual 3 5-cyclic-AMP and -GMP phosphodiesterase 11 n=1 Tax=Biomphalaria pfeifferi TaxID=112525 RepID=A0AAD8AQ85_BIOPF|nr:dual 3 5-cyclic-AMP and -GMP phosphodiesterase 11 [Biomphalaria pfeifferi]
MDTDQDKTASSDRTGPSSEMIPTSASEGSSSEVPASSSSEVPASSSSEVPASSSAVPASSSAVLLCPPPTLTVSTGQEAPSQNSPPSPDNDAFWPRCASWSPRSPSKRGVCYAVSRLSGNGVPSNHPLLSGDGGAVNVDEDTRREYEVTEKWLDDNPTFLYSYYASKSRESLYNAWMYAHALSGVDYFNYPSDVNTNIMSPGTSPGTDTPVCKISAQELEKGGILSPVINLVDGLPSFIGTSPSSTPTQPRSRRRSKSDLMSLDEKQLMHELMIDIFNELDVTSLCFKILQNMCILLNADRCSMFLVKQIWDKKYLVSTLFDVRYDSEFESVSTKMEKIQIPFGKGICGYVAENAVIVNIANAYEVGLLIFYHIFRTL